MTHWASGKVVELLFYFFIISKANKTFPGIYPWNVTLPPDLTWSVWCAATCLPGLEGPEACVEALPGAGVDSGNCTPLLVSSVFFCLLTWLSGFTDGFSCLYLIYHAQNRCMAPRAPKWNYGLKVAWIMQTASRGWADGGDTVSTFSTNSLWNTIWGKNSHSVIIQQEIVPQNWNEYCLKYKFISLLLMSNLTLTVCWPIIYSTRYW